MGLIEDFRGFKFYTGDRSQWDKVSVTEVSGDDPLQMYLRRQFGSYDANQMSQGTMGNIFDVGIREIVSQIAKVDGKAYDANYGRIEMKLPDGTTLTGEPDLIDNEDKVIYDVKLTKIYTWTSVKKGGHQYSRQVNYYRMIEPLFHDYKMALWIWLKDQSDVKKDHPDEAMVIQPIEFIADQVLIDYALDKINDMKAIRDGSLVKEKCDDVWRDLRCSHYCDVSKHCPYAKKRGYTGVAAW